MGTQRGRALRGVAVTVLALLSVTACSSSGGQATSATPQQQYETLLTTPFSGTGIPGQAAAPAIAPFVYADSGPDKLVGAVEAKLAPDGATVESLTFSVFADAAAARARSFRGRPAPISPAGSSPLKISKGVGWCDSDPTPDGQPGRRSCTVIIQNIVIDSYAGPVDSAPASSSFNPLDADATAQVALVHATKTLSLS